MRHTLKINASCPPIINRLNLGGPTYNAAYLSACLPSEFETLLVSGMKEESEESSEYIVNQLGLRPIYIPESSESLTFLVIIMPTAAFGRS